MGDAFDRDQSLIGVPVDMLDEWYWDKGMFILKSLYFKLEEDFKIRKVNYLDLTYDPNGPVLQHDPIETWHGSRSYLSRYSAFSALQTNRFQFTRDQDIAELIENLEAQLHCLINKSLNRVRDRNRTVYFIGGLKIWFDRDEHSPDICKSEIYGDFAVHGLMQKLDETGPVKGFDRPLTKDERERMLSEIEKSGLRYAMSTYSNWDDVDCKRFQTLRKSYLAEENHVAFASEKLLGYIKGLPL